MGKEFLLMVLMFLPLNAFADDSGSCGDNVKWYYDEANNKLTIENNIIIYPVKIFL